MLACIAEDRIAFEPCVRLLLLSLKRHCPDLPIYLIFPPATAAFISWIKNFPKVTLDQKPISGAAGFNVKPQVLLSFLEDGNNDVLWIDSDILVVKPFLPLFEELASTSFVVTEEALGGDGHYDGGDRARRWGFDVGRILPFAVNTAIIRATVAHKELLGRWRELLESKPYQDAQRLEWYAKPRHLNGDQDVLTAVLSDRQYSDIPVKLLRRGADIIQYFGHRGYTVAERTSNIFGRGPLFVHAQGLKPWIRSEERTPPSDIPRYLYAVYQELSPYTIAAQMYRSHVCCDTEWMQAHFVLSRFLRTCGLWYPPLVGLPIAAVWDLSRILRLSWAGILRALSIRSAATS